MDEKELRLLSYLRKDARISLNTVAQDIQMPVSTIYDKLSQLQKNDIVNKFTTLVNFSKLGFHYHAKLAVKVVREQKKELLLFLQKNIAVNSVSEINNGYDFFIETLHHNIKEYLAFIEGLQECFEITDLQEYQIIKEIEKERIFSY